MSNIDALLMRSVIKKTTDDYGLNAGMRFMLRNVLYISQNKVPKLNNGQIADGAAELR